MHVFKHQRELGVQYCKTNCYIDLKTTKPKKFHKITKQSSYKLYLSKFHRKKLDQKSQIPNVTFENIYI